MDEPSPNPATPFLEYVRGYGGDNGTPMFALRLYGSVMIFWGIARS